MNMQTFENALAKAEVEWLQKRVAKLVRENVRLEEELNLAKLELIETQKSSLNLIKQVKEALRIEE
jgi:hypothetical protein